VTVQGSQRSDKVDMYVGKVGVRYQNGGWLELDIPLDLDPLAEQQVLAINVMVLAICGQQNMAIYDEASASPTPVGSGRSAATGKPPHAFVLIPASVRPLSKHPPSRDPRPQLGR
jgi:hypothetical protein